MLHYLKGFLVASPKVCEGCIAKDYFIAFLKEDLHKKDLLINELYNDSHGDMKEILGHVTGMNRIQTAGGDNKVTSIDRRQFTMAGRIAHAEKVDKEAAGQLTAQRKKEYDERITSLLKPSTEVTEEPIKENA